MPAFRKENLYVLLEIALVFAVFALYGAWPVPDVNEAHYLSKTFHFWNPAWGANDFFLNSKDAHLAFYLGFGWLSLWLSPVVLVWVGRLTTWWLLAWSWRRLNGAVLHRRWSSIATGAVMLFLIDHFAFAGEWIVGGVEAKGFAYVLVLLGLENMVRNRWNRAWLCFGGASMIHVLVGGWSAVAAGLAWLAMPRAERPTLRSMWPGLFGGLLLSLPSLLIAMRLSWSVDPKIVDVANQIYVFQRLDHHLHPASFSVLHFALLMFSWLAIRWQTPDTHPAGRLHGFVTGAVLISMTGFGIAYATMANPSLSAALLRFYWFRLSDIMVPLGVAVGVPVLIEQAWARKPALARFGLVGLLALAVWQVGLNVGEHVEGRAMRGIHEPVQDHLDDWRAACRWIATSETVPPDAVFLTPRLCRTFKWYTGRGEVFNRKDIPQNPRSIVEWWERQQVLHTPVFDEFGDRRFPSLAERGEWRLQVWGRRYEADYVITAKEPRLNLPVEYENDSFVVYRLWDNHTPR